MSSSSEKAKEIIDQIRQNEPIDSVKSKVSTNNDQWFRYASKAYNLSIEEARKERKDLESKKYVSAASNTEIDQLINLNERLADYALLLPIFSTDQEFQIVKNLATDLPRTENSIINIIGTVTLNPVLRALQKKGESKKLNILIAFQACWTRLFYLFIELTSLVVI